MNNDINKLKEFDDHKLVSYIFDKKSGLQGYIAIHRGNTKHPAFGATRYWNYSSQEDALKDALRLSRAMSYKAAMAMLPYGGAKAVLRNRQEINGQKKPLLRAYANSVNYLGGHFITGTDVGISGKDVKYMCRYSKYFVGTKTDPARYTALGVFFAIEICAKEVFANKPLSNLTFSIKGIGKTGYELLKLIYKQSRCVYVADVDEGKLIKAKKDFPNVSIVNPNKIHSMPVDFYCPCALGKCINQKNIKELKCAVIAGSANNQLEDPGIGRALHKLGILYAPDFVVNAGGLISVVDEYENGNYRVGRTTKRVEVVKQNMMQVLKTSKKDNKPTSVVADELARTRLENNN